MASSIAVPTRSELLEEHRALRTTIAGIEQDLARRPKGKGVGDWWEDMSYRLRLLRVQLRGHFSSEETAGLLERIQQLAPEHSAACEHLLAQHATVLQRLDDLAAEASIRGDVSRWTKAMRALLADITRHEHDEDELVYRALDTTPGAPD
jgi:hypothetical protein